MNHVGVVVGLFSVSNDHQVGDSLLPRVVGIPSPYPALRRSGGKTWKNFGQRLLLNRFI